MEKNDIQRSLLDRFYIYLLAEIGGSVLLYSCLLAVITGRELLVEDGIGRCYRCSRLFFAVHPPCPVIYGSAGFASVGGRYIKH